jgi:hypothetical protein
MWGRARGVTLKALLSALAGAIVLITALSACGGGGGGGERAGTTTTTGSTTTDVPVPSAGAVEAVTTLGPGLSIGITERNANLLQPPDTGPAIDPGFASGRRRLAGLRPQLYRLAIDWSGLQPDAAVPAQVDGVEDGCSRGTPPCGEYAGLRATFRALAAQQRLGGFAALVTFYGVPDWAAAAPAGCEGEGTQGRSRPINDAGLRGYRALIKQVSALARSEGAAISWWSPWNEPNGAFFISPQRPRCASSAPPLSTGVYTRLARAMDAALREVPGSHAVVVGELAGVAPPSPRGSGSGEFLRGLPDDVLCGAAAISQHLYAHLPGQKLAGGDPLAATEAAIAARRCLDETPVWITETGVGGLHVGEARDTSAASLVQQCRAYARQLRRWAASDRVEAAFQYSFREDPTFPTGLLDAALGRTYPTYDLLAAWTRRPSTDAPAPALPGSCRA